MFALPPRWGMARTQRRCPANTKSCTRFWPRRSATDPPPTLWAVAHGQEGQVAPVWEQEEEEEGVLAFQTYLNGGPLSPPLERLVERGLHLEELRAEAKLLLRS